MQQRKFVTLVINYKHLLKFGLILYIIKCMIYDNSYKRIKTWIVRKFKMKYYFM